MARERRELVGINAKGEAGYRDSRMVEGGWLRGERGSRREGGEGSMEKSESRERRDAASFIAKITKRRQGAV